MLYESYQKKIKKIAKTLSKLVKLSPLIIGAVVLIIAGIVALLASKGAVGDLTCRSEVIYGESLECNADAFLSDVDYEYCVKGGDWVEKEPLTPGEYQVRAKAYDIWGKPRYSNVESFTIKQRSSTISVAGSSVVYGEFPQLAADLQYDDYIVCDAFKYVDALAKKTEITPVMEAVKVLSGDGEDVTHCYVFEAVTKEVSITSRKLGITVLDHTEVYNGKEIFSHEYEITEGSVKSGDILNAAFSLVMVEHGSKQNSAEITVKNGDGVDVTYMYSISVQSGTLTVEKRPLMITTSGREEDYCGKEITSPEYTVSEGTPIAEGQSLSLELIPSYKNVGEYSNTLEFTVFDENGKDVFDNYALELVEGTVKINPIELLVKTNGGSWTYDGIYHSDEALNVKGLLKDHSVSIVSNIAEIRDVGSLENKLEIAVDDEFGDDVTFNYIVKYDFGTFTVTKRPLLISTQSFEFVYDGTEHRAGDPIVSGLATTDDLFPEILKKTDAGVYDNTIGDYSILNEDGENQIKNYDITHEFGKLTISRREITVKPVDVSKVYDGAYLSSNSFELTASSKYDLAAGHEIVGKIKGEIRDAGEIASEITEIVLLDGDRDVTKNYEVKLEKGKITISLRRVVIYTLNMYWPYDGKSHSAPDDYMYDESYGGLRIVDGEKLVVLECSSVTEVTEGRVKNEFSKVKIITDDSEERDVTHNYDLVIKNNGELWVNPRPITITLEDLICKYDDKAHYNNTPVIGQDGLAEGQFIDITEYASRTDVGRTQNYIKYTIRKSDPAPGENADKTANYKITEKFGYIEITPRVLKILLPDKTWTYDGLEHYFIDYKLAEDGDKPVAGHNIVINDYATITDAGEKQNYIDISIIKDLGAAPITGEDPDKTSNYVFDFSGVGKLIVNKRYIKIRTDSLTATYDGYEHSTTKYKVVAGDCAPGQYIEVVSSTVVEDHTPEPVDNEFVIAIRDSGRRDRSYNYDIEYDLGKLNILKRDLWVTTKSQSWLYDGRTHSYAELGVGVIAVGMADGQSVVVDEYTTITDAGSAKNEVTVLVMKDDPRPGENANKTANYNINYAYGNLTVNKRTLFITTGTLVSKYDGQPQTCTDYTYTGDGFAPGQILKVIESTAVENYTPNPVKNEFTKYEIIDSQNVDRKSNYDITFINGTITINKRELLIRTGSKTWLYDGLEQQLTFDDNGGFLFELLLDGVAEGQSFVVENYAKITDAGSKVNEVTGRIYKKDPITGKEVETTANYIITTDYGLLEVTKRTVHIVTETNHNTIYDGQPHRFTGYEALLEGLAPNQKLTFTDSTAVTYFTEGILKNVFKGYDIVDAEGKSRIYNYVFTIEWGEISIQKRPVVLNTVGDSKVFDGTPLTCTKYTVADLSLYDIVVGETLRVNSSSSVTYVTEGAVDNIFYDISIIDASGVDRYDNYHIQYYEYGKLIITPRMLSVYSGSAEKLFDHTPLVEPECGLMIGEGYGTLVEGHTITVVATGSRTVPGVSINTVKCSIADSNGNDMTENYHFNDEHLGTLRVLGRSVKVMLASWTKEYNGSEWRMTTNDCRARSDSDVIVEILDLNISRKNVGAVTLEDINITPERYVTLKAYMYIDGSLVEITRWCSIEFYCSQNNVLEVTPKSITLTADSVTIKYDENSPGLSAEPDGFAVTVGPIVAGHTVNAYVFGEVLGSPNNSVTAECRIDEDSVIIFDENGDDVTSNYVIELKPGILEIVPEEKEE